MQSLRCHTHEDSWAMVVTLKGLEGIFMYYLNSIVTHRAQHLRYKRRLGQCRMVGCADWFVTNTFTIHSKTPPVGRPLAMSDFHDDMAN